MPVVNAVLNSTIIKRPANPQTLPIGQVTCPNCAVIMGRIALGIADERTGLRAGTYRCPRCEAKTVRWIK
jgi:hypothetical protein